MARISKKNIISGRIGDLVFREFNGKQVVQTRPEEMKQTKATQMSSSEFTRCSRWAKWLRLFLIPVLVGLTDSFMYKRFTGQLYTALQSNIHLLKGERNPCNADMSALAGFEFNTHSPFVAYFFPALTASLDAHRQLTVTIPAFDPKTEMVFAGRTTQAELLVYVLATNFDQTAPITEDHFILPIHKNTPLQATTLWTSPVLPENYFVLVTAKLLFYTTNTFTVKNYINSKEMSPAIVVLAAKT